MTTRLLAAVLALLSLGANASAQGNDDLDAAINHLQQGRIDEGIAPMRRAAEAGDPFGRYLLAGLTAQGYATGEPDPAAARELYRLAADQDMPAAAFALANLLLEGRGGDADAAGALRWHERAGLMGHAFGAFNAGVLHATGQGTDRDLAQALAWFQLADELGAGPAAGAMEQARRDLDADGQAEARRRFDALNEQSQAVMNEGVRTLTFGLAEIEDAAYARAEQAYLDGDYETALGLLRPLVRADYGDALFYLARMYETGRGIEADPRVAAQLYTLAINRHASEAALWNLGILYLNGQGVERDFEVAAMLYEAAARRGQAGPMRFLGEFHLRGDVAEKDLAKAYAWLSLAAERGVAEARDLLAEVEREADAATIERGRALAAEIGRSMEAGEVGALPQLPFPAE